MINHSQDHNTRCQASPGTNLSSISWSCTRSDGGSGRRVNTEQQLRKKGCPDAVIELIQQVQRLIVDRFDGTSSPYRRLAEHMGFTGEEARRQSKRLSDRISGRRNGPRWPVVVEVIGHCVEESLRPGTTDLLAALWMRANDGKAPPGYQRPETHDADDQGEVGDASVDVDGRDQAAASTPAVSVAPGEPAAALARLLETENLQLRRELDTANAALSRTAARLSEYSTQIGQLQANTNRALGWKTEAELASLRAHEHFARLASMVHLFPELALEFASDIFGPTEFGPITVRRNASRDTQAIGFYVQICAAFHKLTPSVIARRAETDQATVTALMGGDTIPALTTLSSIVTAVGGNAEHIEHLYRMRLGPPPPTDTQVVDVAPAALHPDEASPVPPRAERITRTIVSIAPVRGTLPPGHQPANRFFVPAAPGPHGYRGRHRPHRLHRRARPGRGGLLPDRSRWPVVATLALALVVLAAACVPFGVAWQRAGILAFHYAVGDTPARADLAHLVGTDLLYQWPLLPGQSIQTTFTPDRAAFTRSLHGSLATATDPTHGLDNLTCPVRITWDLTLDGHTLASGALANYTPSIDLATIPSSTQVTTHSRLQLTAHRSDLNRCTSSLRWTHAGLTIDTHRPSP